MKKIMIFFLKSKLGIAITITGAAIIFYFIAPVLTQAIIFEGLIRHLPKEVLVVVGLWFGNRLAKKYKRENTGLKLHSITIGYFVSTILFTGGLAVLFGGMLQRKIYFDSKFVDLAAMPNVSIEHLRYTPQQVAAEEIVRRTQSSEFTPGPARAIGSATGVAYVTPLIPQGFWNMLISKNSGFMYYEDGGSEESVERVRQIPTKPFEIGEGMEVTDDIRRALVRKIGFFKSYPEIYYAPINREDGKFVEMIGVVPYVSYYIYWGLLVPYWGGVAIFHDNGKIENLTIEAAQNDNRLRVAQRLFPETMAKLYVESQRCDQGLISCWIRRPGKISIPTLPGKVQMPFFLPMNDGTYQYVTATEPDGEAYSLMRLYYINARTGERSVYFFDRDGRSRTLQGPDKVLSYVKRIPGYNWYEEEGGKSGSYRIIEPRLVTKAGRIYWMMSITPIDFARVVATVFVDAQTNDVAGPFLDRTSAFKWFNDDANNDPQRISQSAVLPANNIEFCARLKTVCAEISAICPTQ